MPGTSVIRHPWESATRGKMIYFREIPVSGGFPRVADDADRTGITYATHGKMIYFAHALRWRGRWRCTARNWRCCGAGCLGNVRSWSCGVRAKLVSVSPFSCACDRPVLRFSRAELQWSGCSRVFSRLTLARAVLPAGAGCLGNVCSRSCGGRAKLVSVFACCSACARPVL